MTSSVRAFVALPIGGSLAARCAEASRALRLRPAAARVGARWVPENYLHVTLRFLGEIPASRLPEVQTAMATAAAAMGPTELRAGPVLALGGRRARVIALELTAAPPLARLVATLDRELARLGFPPEGRSFRAHVTLARLRRPGPVGDWLEGLTVDPASEIVAEIVLFRSELTPSGARYTRLAGAPLGARGPS